MYLAMAASETVAQSRRDGRHGGRHGQARRAHDSGARRRAACGPGPREKLEMEYGTATNLTIEAKPLDSQTALRALVKQLRASAAG